MFRFRKYSRIFAAPPGHPPVQRFCGPPLALIGWIPFAGIFNSELPAGAGVRRAVGYKMMYQAGNGEPPLFPSRQEFLDYLNKTKEFRGALALDPVTALLDEEGSFVGVELEYLGCTGFTPFRIAPGTPCHMAGGIGEGNLAIVCQPQEFLSIELVQFFKMGRAADMANWLITGARASSAMVHLVYTFYRNESVQIEIQGTAIPSLSVTVDWSWSRLVYDMQSASHKKMSNFFDAGPCTTAPLAVREDLPPAGARRETVRV